MASAENASDMDNVGVEDMIALNDLNEHSILRNLKNRYARDHIYTYTGSILVAVNPYKMFNIYGLDMVKRYEGQALGDLPPHLFAVGNTSYTKMMKDKENQVLVISGESGAGKTESTKLVMQYLAAVNKSGNNLITEQILEANPLLESFGNAKTIRNDNSSRFGKYIEVYFKDGQIVGAKTSEYLLEKSRIVTQAPEERNYHVFYEMLEALSDEQKSKYGLQTAPKYFYLNQGGSSLIPQRDDAGNYRKLMAAMDILDFQRQEQDTIIKILASVLHIGNIYFSSAHIDNHDTAQLGSDAEIKWISHLLELSDIWLKQALTSKVTEARGERVVSPYNLNQALDARDAIAKALYSRLFSWLVERVNYIICRSERDKTTSLAVLDIFGFEDFHFNSFEQLCINYANETLQYFFNQHIFRLEQKEYTKEKIHWEHIEFKDNQPTIDLIATKPAGILHILDDESNFPQASDQSFLEKCHFHHSGNELYDKPRMSDPEFFIAHYAGKIKYNVQHFLEKNKDTLRTDVVELLCESKNKMISQMFEDLRDRSITKTLSKTTGRYVTLKPRTPTVAASFNESLVSLIDTMSRCNPFFVRCIKPNATKSPMIFEDIVVLDQLRYTGMLETIRIRRMGYPVRIKFPQFFERYHCLLRGKQPSRSQVPWDVCKQILQTQGPDFKDEYQVGATKVFMKESFEQRLDVDAKKIQSKAATRLQTQIRMFIAFKKHQKQRVSAHKLQRMIRMWRARRQFKALRHGIVLAQAQYRMFFQRRKYLRTREQIRQRLEEEKFLRKKKEAQERLEREKRPGGMIQRRISQLFDLQDFSHDFTSDNHSHSKQIRTGLNKNVSFSDRNVKIKERQAQMMASIVNLDIPGELALVYSKLDEWDPPHAGENIITTLGDVVPMDMGYKLPVDINSHAFSKYTSVYFKNPVWGVQMEPIRTSLTPVQGDENNAIALAVFKLILRFMCDTQMSEKKGKLISDFIINLGLKHEGIRDEILCQLVNQTWLSQNKERAERVWLLLANCLSCFNPSPTLFKFLLKYVSDVGMKGLNILCQHKILQSAYMATQLSRVYPPTYLEWKAIQRRSNMALEVQFPDGINAIGHVESWTSGELFTSHLLKLRGLRENSQGWTLALQEDVDYYELMGYDYVLDLISEIEVPPAFPAGTGHFLVSMDKSKERMYQRRYVTSCHNTERDRYLILTSPLPEMIKRDIPIATATSSSQSQSYLAGSKKSAVNDDLGFSTTSVLNQRPTEILPQGLAEGSKMNNRYTKRSRAPGPPMMNGHITNGIANGHIPTINEAEEDDNNNIINAAKDPSELSVNKLNGRYFPNGDAKTAESDGELSYSKLNHRYKKSNVVRGKHLGVPDHMKRKHMSREEVLSVNSDHTDWSHLVEDIFNNALNDHVEQDGRMLGSRIKGGGQGIPGLQTQQPIVQPVNLNLGLGVQQPIVPPLNLNPTSPLTNGIADPVQQVAAQQIAQQQAILQAYLSQQQQQQQQQQTAILQASLQQQQQQQQQQAALQNSHQQTAALKTALQQQELQNKLLKQSIEQEMLKQQLQQMQLQPQPVPLLTQFSPSSSLNAGMNMGLNNSFVAPAAPAVIPQAPVIVNGGMPHQPSPSETSSTEPKRVKFIKSTFENKQPPAVSPRSPPVVAPKTHLHFEQPAQAHSSTSTTRTISITSTAVADVPVALTALPPAPSVPITSAPPPAPPPPPPPPPPVAFADAPPLHTQPSNPPTPPPSPPPPVTVDIDKESGTFTIRDKSGRARTVRVGKVVWPPPVERESRGKIQVGKLEIDEQMASEIASGFNKKQTKTVSVKPEDESAPKSILKKDEENSETRKFQRTKSLVETSHIHTLRLLEKKLGGGSQESSKVENTTTETVMKSFTPPELPPFPPPIPAVSSSSEVSENIYSTAIVSDEPPPLPDRPPNKSMKKIISETTETTEIKRTSAEYNRSIQFDEVDAVKAIEAPPQIDYSAFEKFVTELYPQNKKFFLMYNKIPWILQIRKEVFWPSEKLENPAVLHLIYCQIVHDVYNFGCIRIIKDQRIKMRGMLEGYGINHQNLLTTELKPQIKKVIVDTAREWPTYFCRLFPIAASGQYASANYLGISHTGLRLIQREKSLVDDQLTVMEEIRFEDIIDVMLPTNSTVQLNLRTKSFIFRTTRAQQLKDMIDRFCLESEKGNKYVVAIRDYVTRESTLLSFKRGQIIKLIDPEMDLEDGWLYGSLNGIVGLFPTEHVKSLARHEVETSSSKPMLYQPRPPSIIRQESHTMDDQSETSQGTIVADGKYSMMEFAMLHFRESLEKYEMLRTDDGSIRGTVKMMENFKLQSMKTRDYSKRGSGDWSWREQAELVKWSRSPIQVSLLKLTSPELNKVALECFIAIMRFMGDYPMGSSITEYDCAKKILQSCHKYPQLRDEVFCQLCKQTTNNRSMHEKSKVRGWRLFALVASYFDCSDTLRPYLFKYLETTASDSQRSYNNAASLCLNNLRKTFKYGGRKDVPLKEEVVALADGRNCKRFPFFYSGVDTQGGMLQVKSCTIVQDALEEVCKELNIIDSVEMEEYTFFVRWGQGTFSKLNREDYILDEAAYYIRRQIKFDLIFQRTVWYFPLKHMDNETFIDMMYHQCLLDYIEGFLIVLPGGKLTKETIADVATLGALLFKANNMAGVPTMKDLNALVPANVRNLPETRQQQWLNRIHENLSDMGPMSSIQAKARFVNILKQWNLFGSTFFKIRRIPNISGESFLAVNHQGISFIRYDTHETIMQHPFSEILSTRRYRSDSNINYLDMKLGNLMVQQILRIETDQGSDISDLIGQYMQVINRHRKRQDVRAIPNGHN